MKSYIYYDVESYCSISGTWGGYERFDVLEAAIKRVREKQARTTGIKFRILKHTTSTAREEIYL